MLERLKWLNFYPDLFVDAHWRRCCHFSILSQWCLLFLMRLTPILWAATSILYKGSKPMMTVKSLFTVTLWPSYSCRVIRAVWLSSLHFHLVCTVWISEKIHVPAWLKWKYEWMKILACVSDLIPHLPPVLTAHSPLKLCTLFLLCEVGSSLLIGHPGLPPERAEHVIDRGGNQCNGS